MQKNQKSSSSTSTQVRRSVMDPNAFLLKERLRCLIIKREMRKRTLDHLEFMVRLSTEVEAAVQHPLTELTFPRDLFQPMRQVLARIRLNVSADTSVIDEEQAVKMQLHELVGVNPPDDLIYLWAIVASHPEHEDYSRRHMIDPWDNTDYWSALQEDPDRTEKLVSNLNSQLPSSGFLVMGIYDPDYTLRARQAEGSSQPSSPIGKTVSKDSSPDEKTSQTDNRFNSFLTDFYKFRDDVLGHLSGIDTLEELLVKHRSEGSSKPSTKRKKLQPVEVDQSGGFVHVDNVLRQSNVDVKETERKLATTLKISRPLGQAHDRPLTRAVAKQLVGSSLFDEVLAAGNSPRAGHDESHDNPTSPGPPLDE